MYTKCPLHISIGHKILHLFLNYTYIIIYKFWFWYANMCTIWQPWRGPDFRLDFDNFVISNPNNVGLCTVSDSFTTASPTLLKTPTICGINSGQHSKSHWPDSLNKNRCELADKFVGLLSTRPTNLSASLTLGWQTCRLAHGYPQKFTSDNEFFSWSQLTNLLACSALGRQTWWLAWAELGLKNWANERKYLQNKHRVTRLLPSLLGDLGSFFQNFRSSRNILARYFFSLEIYWLWNYRLPV
jgi:hypothetical protein